MTTNLTTLRRRLTQAATAAEKEREKAEREGHPATRDLMAGEARGLRKAVAMIMEEEAKERWQSTMR